MNEIPLEIINGKFNYNFNTYDCSSLIERDKRNILREAEETHNGVIDRLYIRESLQPHRCHAYTDDNGNIIYLMIIYTITYKEGKDLKRIACGDSIHSTPQSMVDYFPILIKEVSVGNLTCHYCN